jgi:effector-binding domain-containing protein/uncharacterized protein YndB with AHSA1/START domain
VKVLKPILIGLVALIVLLALIGLFLPSAAHVERSVSIAAPPAAIYDIVNDLRRFNEWSPWFEKDPQARYSFSGPENGVGSRLEWSSNDSSVGTGSQEIVESAPDQRVRTRLDFGSQGKGEAVLTIAPGATGTKVTWGFDTDLGNNILARYFGLAMDSIVGAEYAHGLGKLKALAESTPVPAESEEILKITEVDAGAIDIAYVEGITSLDPDAISKALGTAYSQIGQFMQSHALRQGGPPLAINRFYDESGWGFKAAIPVEGVTDATRAAASQSGVIRIGHTYAGRALKGIHIGDHSTLPDAYRALEDYMVAKGLDANGPSWEQYISDPVSTPDDKLQTDVYMPVKAGATGASGGTAN